MVIMRMRSDRSGRVVLLAALLLGSTVLALAQNATDAQPGKHGKRVKARWATADSLRLELRKAADEGRMFQWGDSLLRERLGKSKIDSARYMRLQARLRRADQRLHKGDKLLEEKYRKISFDTLYISRPNARWTIKLRTNLSGAQLKFYGVNGQSDFNGDLRADYRGTISVAAAYRGIAVGLAVNPAKLAGKSKDNEFNLNSYGNKFGFDVVLLSSKTYHGTVESNGGQIEIAKGQLQQKAVNINLYYAFNGRRFSFPAAFSQSYVQKRSAGSFMLGMSMDGQYTNACDVMAGSGVGNAKMRIYALGIGAGYGYNLVAGRHWLFHLSSLPTFDVLLRSYASTGEGKINLHYRFPSVIITGRGAAVYSWNNKFFGATMVFNYSSVGSENRLKIERAKERLRLFYGFRF